MVQPPERHFCNACARLALPCKCRRISPSAPEGSGRASPVEDSQKRSILALETSAKERPRMAQGLYLGKRFDPKSGALGDRIDLDPADLLTHGLIVGMTGSGKTGLAIALLEELLRQGIPVLAIDPKGDLGNLLLLFDSFDAASFQPWIDLEAARREGQAASAAASATAAGWTTGLAEWGLSTKDAGALLRARDAVIYTPGSRSGVPLNVLQSLEAPKVDFESAEEDLRDEIAGIVAGLLGLLHIDADPLQSREAVFLANLI